MIKNLVISGGGIRIMTIIGAIKYLEEKNILCNIEKFYGTSAGSILCLLIILGFNNSEIIRFIENFNLNKIFKIDTDNFFTNYSICNNNKFEKLIKLFINFKITTNNLENLDIDRNYENITMLELFNKTNKHLIVTTASIKQKKAVYIDHLLFPELPVWKAILMSCSIPFIFQPVSWENDLYIDGGLIDNFPLFNIPQEEIKYTLGLETNIEHEIYDNYSNIYEYIYDIYKVITQTNKTYKYYNIITIKIGKNMINSSIDVDISNDIKNSLINEGYKQSCEIFPLLFQDNINEKSTQTEPIINNLEKKKRSYSI